MEYGCIGEHLKHSFSKEIHNAFAEYEYEIREIEKENLGDFAKTGDFRGINVTIPYKELIMPFLHSIDEAAKAIGAVNTVVNKNGRLFGYNTDFYGMSELIRHAGIGVNEKKVIVLGTGGTSKTAVAVASSMGAREIVRVSRTAKEDAIDYEILYKEHTDAQIIINTTPVGMYPDISGKPIALSAFPNLHGVIDAIYNPLRTPLIQEAMSLNIPAEGGLYMLVAQAIRASEIFLNKSYPADTCDRVYREILSSKENIVLVGMPSSGKSTVGKIIAEKMGREFIDTDEIIVKNYGANIPEIFKDHGETHFRALECDAVKEAAAHSSAVIATGGGAVLNSQNIALLKENGRLYFLDRPFDKLIPTSDRPLSSDIDALKKRYDERFPIYNAVCDEKIVASDSAESVAEQIISIALKN